MQCSSVRKARSAGSRLLPANRSSSQSGVETKKKRSYSRWIWMWLLCHSMIPSKFQKTVYPCARLHRIGVEWVQLYMSWPNLSNRWGLEFRQWEKHLTTSRWLPFFAFEADWKISNDFWKSLYWSPKDVIETRMLHKCVVKWNRGAALSSGQGLTDNGDFFQRKR